MLYVPIFQYLVLNYCKHNLKENYSSTFQFYAYSVKSPDSSRALAYNSLG